MPPDLFESNPQRPTGASVVLVSVSVRPYWHQFAFHGRGISRRLLNPATPSAGSLVERYGRVHFERWISVTDRYNLGRVGQMPEEGVTYKTMFQLHPYGEVARLARPRRDADSARQR